MFCRMVALPVGRVPIVLNVDAPDSALTAAFQATGAALAATYLPCPGPGDAPEYRAAIREAVGFAIKGGPHRHRAQARPVLLPGRPRGAGAGIPILNHRAPPLSAGPYAGPTVGHLARSALMGTGPTTPIAWRRTSSSRWVRARRSGTFRLRCRPRAARLPRRQPL